MYLRYHFRNNTSLRFLQNLQFEKNIFISAADGKERIKRRNNHVNKDSRNKLNDFVQEHDEILSREKEFEYYKRLKELKTLTSSVSRIIKEKKQKEKREEEVRNLPMPSDLNVESEKLYKSLESGEHHNESLSRTLMLEYQAVEVDGFDSSKLTLITPTVKLPAAISERLGLTLRYLVSKEDQNWNLVLSQLDRSGGFEGIASKDVSHFILNIPPNHLKNLIPQVENLLSKGNVQKSSAVVNAFLGSLVSGRSVDETTMNLFETYIKYLRSHNKKGKLSRKTFELMIQAYGKNNNLEKINACLAEMKERNMHPSPSTYSNILTTCVYKANNHKQAVAIFDAMKFMSGQTKPNTRTYQDIIVSYINNDDVEKSLDLYKEMLIDKIPLNQKILVALARGCTSRPELRSKAWDFIFEIHDQGWEPTLETYEYILYLAAKDGDIALARTLYKQLHNMESSSSRSFSFLLLAYSKSNVAEEVTEIVKPLPITVHEKGRIFRRNILSDQVFAPEIEPLKNTLPFLPVLDLSTSRQVMAESSAMWAHALMVHPDFINRDSSNTMLNIAAKMGTVEDFVDRYENCTFLDRTTLPADKKISIEEGDDSKLNAKLNVNHPPSTKSPLLSHIQVVDQRKVPRTCLTYIIALKVAGKYKNYNFAQNIWSERGLYRKTESFKQLPRSTKDHLDFTFASSMVSCLTKIGLLDDALAILVSTEYQFKWTWKELNELYRAAVEVGNEKICRTIRGVSKRAQMNFAGKIRRKDFKKYVMERGYK